MKTCVTVVVLQTQFVFCDKILLNCVIIFVISCLSRRYYYDGDMISKVQGKRFVYKFVCDLRTLIGYSAAELNNLVTECEQKKLARMQMHGIGQPITTVTLAPASLDKDS